MNDFLDQTKREVEKRVDQVTAKANEAKDAFVEKIGHAKEGVVETAGQAKEKIVETAGEVHAEARAYVQKNPEKATGIALGVGTFFGAIIGFLTGRKK